MTTIAYRDRDTGAYPISAAEVRSRVNMLYGEEPTPEVLDAANVDPVSAVEQPAHDPATHYAEEGAPELVNGAWRQTWSIIAYPPPPPPPPIEISADLLFGERMTDEEYDALDDSVRTGETARLYRAWAAATRFVEGSAMWDLLAKHLGLTVTPERKADLLARPSDAQMAAMADGDVMAA